MAESPLKENVKESERSLYRRLGGYDVIAAAIDGMLTRMRADPRFARFTGGRGEESTQRGRQLLIDQLCALSGGPCIYIGRDMKTFAQGTRHQRGRLASQHESHARCHGRTEDS